MKATSLENTRLYNDFQEQEAKVRRLVESNIIGIFIWDFEDRIIEANEAFLHIVGRGRDDLVSGDVRWTALTPTEWRDADERAMTELRATGSCKASEKEYLRNDGSRVPVLVGAATLSGRRDRGVAFVLDLTERKEVEKNLRESEQRYREAQAELAHVTRITTLGELTASIAHEVNQPLAAVLANAEACLLWLDRETPDLEGVRRSVEWIIKDGNRAGEVIRRVRALVNNTIIKKAPLHINNVIEDVMPLVRQEVRIQSISLRLELGSALPAVLGDRVELQQVIVNLVMNGIQAMNTTTRLPRELYIRSREHRPDQILVEVEDTGIGIEPEHIDRLFNAFFTTKPDGMGVGLWICRSIIERHDGRVWVTSKRGTGSTFQFTLPALPAPTA
jgi:PAS domain S-box-containing protein